MREPVNERGEIVRGVCCPVCAADLVGRRAAENCGGCGGLIAALLGRQLGRLDESGCLTGATACGRCGYDLRTMPLSATCPECGTAAAESALRMRLCEAPQWWLLTVRWGMDVVLIAALAGLSFPLLFMLSWLFARGNFAPGILSGLGESFFRLFYFAVSASMAVGVMMITTRDPTRFQQRPCRGLTRFFAAAAAVVAAGGIVGEVGPDRSILAGLILAISIAATEMFAARVRKLGEWPELLIFVLAACVALLVGAIAYSVLPRRFIERILDFFVRTILGGHGHLETEPLIVALVFGPLVFFGTRYVASILDRIPRKRAAWWVRWHGGLSAIFMMCMIALFTGLYYWNSSFWRNNATSSAPVIPPLLNVLQRLAEFVATIGGWTLGLMALVIEPWARFAVARAIREAREGIAETAASKS